MGFSFNASSCTEKIRFILEDGYSCVSVYRPSVMNALMALQAAMDYSIVTDKGHRSKSAGKSTVEFWIKQPSHYSDTKCDNEPHTITNICGCSDLVQDIPEQSVNKRSATKEGGNILQTTSGLDVARATCAGEVDALRHDIVAERDMDASAVQVAARSEEHATELAMLVHNALETMIDTHFVNLGALFATSPPSEAHLANEREVFLPEIHNFGRDRATQSS